MVLGTSATAGDAALDSGRRCDARLRRTVARSGLRRTALGQSWTDGCPACGPGISARGLPGHLVSREPRRMGFARRGIFLRKACPWGFLLRNGSAAPSTVCENRRVRPAEMFRSDLAIAAGSGLVDDGAAVPRASERSAPLGETWTVASGVAPPRAKRIACCGPAAESAGLSQRSGRNSDGQACQGRWCLAVIAPGLRVAVTSVALIPRTVTW